MELQLISDKVKDVLRKYPEARDNDRYLVFKIWYLDIKHDNWMKMSATDLAKKATANDLADYTSIIRARRRLQKLHIELRGKNYEGNLASAEKFKNQYKKLSS